jgi:hypothetical protein
MKHQGPSSALRISPGLFSCRTVTREDRAGPGDLAGSVVPHYGRTHGSGSEGATGQKRVSCSSAQQRHSSTFVHLVHRSCRHARSARLLARSRSKSMLRRTGYIRASTGGLCLAKYGRIRAWLGSSADPLFARHRAAPLVLVVFTRWHPHQTNPSTLHNRRRPRSRPDRDTTSPASSAALQLVTLRSPVP